MLRSLKNFTSVLPHRNPVRVLARFASDESTKTDTEDVATSLSDIDVSNFDTGVSSQLNIARLSSDIRTVSIRNIFDPREDYILLGNKPRLRIPATDDFQLPDDFEVLVDKYQRKTDSVLLSAYKTHSADITHRRFIKPTYVRQANARKLMKKRRTRELVGLLRKAIDANPKYTAVQRRIVERQQQRDIASGKKKND